MATYCSILAWRIPQIGAWWAPVHGVAKSQTERLTHEAMDNVPRKMRKYLFSLELKKIKIKKNNYLFTSYRLGRILTWD